MRFPAHLLRASTFRAEPLMAAMAAIAVGMFVGTWLIGPAITHNTSAEPPAATAPQERTSFEEMVARPDPLPYRAATPVFETSGVPNYAAAAKEKAQAELGGQTAESDETVAEAPRSSRGSSRYYRGFDRHRIY
jgi:hypothetical protein